MKARKEIICIGLMAGFVLQTLAVGFNTTPSRRLESPRLRTDGVSQKSGSPNDGVGKAKSDTQSDRTSAAKTRRRQSDSSGADTSLLPDGFDVDGAGSPKQTPTESSRKVLSAEGMALKESVKVEYGDGHGETADEALKEAMKDVLQKVVGVYVDSDFRMNNDQIIKDEIITHCNGFIDHYMKIDEADDPNGRGKSVTIKAWVKMRDFVNRMKRMAPRQCVAMDGVLLDSELSDKLSAEALLRKELDGLNPALDLMEVSLVKDIRPAVVEATDNSVTLRYVFQLRYSRRYYKEFVPRLSRLLDQIASGKRKERGLSLEVKKEEVFPWAGDLKRWKECPVTVFYLNLKKRNLKPQNCVSLIARVTKSGAASVREWALSERLNEIYSECMRKARERNRSIVCALRLNDSSGEMLSCASCYISKEYYMGRMVFPDCSDCLDFVPFFPWCDEYGVHRYEWLDRYVACIDITVNREDVPKIKSAEIKLETE